MVGTPFPCVSGPPQLLGNGKGAWFLPKADVLWFLRDPFCGNPFRERCIYNPLESGGYSQERVLGRGYFLREVFGAPPL